MGSKKRTKPKKAVKKAIKKTAKKPSKPVKKATAASRQKARDRRLRVLFNITQEEYDKVLEFQGGVCPITLKAYPIMHLDHNHTTGECRGVLSWRGNSLIGKFRDDVDMLIRAAEYLKHPPLPAALGEKVYGIQGRVSQKVARRRYGPNGTKTPQPRKSIQGEDK